MLGHVEAYWCTLKHIEAYWQLGGLGGQTNAPWYSKTACTISSTEQRKRNTKKEMNTCKTYRMQLQTALRPLSVDWWYMLASRVGVVYLAEHSDAYRSRWRHIEAYWNIWKHTEGYWCIFKHIEAYWGIWRHVWSIFRHMKAKSDIPSHAEANRSLLRHFETCEHILRHIKTYWGVVCLCASLCSSVCLRII